MGIKSFYGNYDIRKEVIFLLLIMLVSVVYEDIAAAVEEKETLPDCRLKPWEVTLLNHQLLQLKLKNLPADIKNTPLY